MGVKPCPMKCPHYEVRNIRKVEDKPTMQADIVVKGIKLNFGTMKSVELGVKLLSKEVKDDKPTPTIKKTDINNDDFEVYINGTIDNLILHILSALKHELHFNPSLMLFSPLSHKLRWRKISSC